MAGSLQRSSASGKRTSTGEMSVGENAPVSADSFQLSDVQSMLQILSERISYGFALYTETFEAIIDSHFKEHQDKLALKLWEEMEGPKRGRKRNPENSESLATVSRPSRRENACGHVLDLSDVEEQAQSAKPCHDHNHCPAVKQVHAEDSPPNLSGSSIDPIRSNVFQPEMCALATPSVEKSCVTSRAKLETTVIESAASPEKLDEVCGTFGALDLRGSSQPDHLTTALVARNGSGMGKDLVLSLTATPMRPVVARQHNSPGHRKRDSHCRVRRARSFDPTLEYLKVMKNLGLTFSRHGGDILTAFADSNYANDKESRKSVLGSAVLYGGTVVAWMSRNQRFIATSPSKADYIGLVETAKDVMVVRQALEFLRASVKYPPVGVFEDNVGGMQQAQSPLSSKRTKYIDVLFHFI